MNDKVKADNNLAVGKKFVATVKNVRTEGVYIEMPNVGSGTISPRCWGVGTERAEALGRVKPGDKLDVVVRSWDARTKTASLVLSGFENHPPRKSRPQPQTTTRVNGGTHQTVAKEAFKPDPPGTTYVFDFANVIGLLPFPCIPNAKSYIEARFSSAGYSTLFYLDRRTVGWLGRALSSDAAKDKFFGDFRASGNASYVGNVKNSTSVRKHEADLAILQTVSAIEGSVACSRDGYEDYVTSFPKVIADRVRQICVVVLPNGSAVLTVEGTGCGAVVIPAFTNNAVVPKVETNPSAEVA